MRHAAATYLITEISRNQLGKAAMEVRIIEIMRVGVSRIAHAIITGSREIGEMR